MPTIRRLRVLSIEGDITNRSLARHTNSESEVRIWELGAHPPPTKHEMGTGSRRGQRTTYADTILRVSYTYLRSTQDAEDICQDVLLKALGHTGSFDSAEHERAWIVRVAINAAKDL